MADRAPGWALTVPLAPDAAAEVRGHLLRWLESLSWPGESRSDVAAAVQEAVANAVKHSGGVAGSVGGRDELVVRISGQVERSGDGRRLRFWVRDPGRWQPPSMTQPWRGLLLMTRLMEQMRIHRRAAGTAVMLLTAAVELA